MTNEQKLYRAVYKTCMIMFTIAITRRHLKEKREREEKEERSTNSLLQLLGVLSAYYYKALYRIKKDKRQERGKEKNCCCTYIVHFNGTEGLTTIIETRKKTLGE